MTVARSEPRRLRRGARLASSWRSLALTLLVVVALAYGWRITRIDPVQLVAGLPNMRHIVAGLLTPDLFTQGAETTSIAVPLSVGGTGQGRAVSPDGRLQVEPVPIQPGADFTVSGSGLLPSTPARLYLVISSAYARPLYSFETTPAGDFRFTFELPANVGPGDYSLRVDVIRPTGVWSASETLLLSLEKIVETVFLALMGTAFSVVFSVPLSFLAAGNLTGDSLPGRIVYAAARTFFNLTRSIEVMIVAIIMAVVVGIGPFAGVLALVIHSIGALGKLYSEAIESIDPGPLEAITATGANRLQVVLFGVLPQVVPQFISFTLYRWDINVRMSTIIGLVGGGGIGYLLKQYIDLLQWNQAGTALWLIAIVVIGLDYASAVIRQRVV